MMKFKGLFTDNTVEWNFVFIDSKPPYSDGMFSALSSWAQEKLIDSLSKKINQVYKVCIGDAEVGSLNAVQKLVKVESRLVELSDLIESVPKENVEAIERIKQKERRQKYCDSLLRLLSGYCV